MVYVTETTHPAGDLPEHLTRQGLVRFARMLFRVCSFGLLFAIRYTLRYALRHKLHFALHFAFSPVSSTPTSLVSRTGSET